MMKRKLYISLIRGFLFGGLLSLLPSQISAQDCLRPADFIINADTIQNPSCGESNGAIKVHLSGTSKFFCPDSTESDFVLFKLLRDVDGGDPQEFGFTSPQEVNLVEDRYVYVYEFTSLPIGSYRALIKIQDECNCELLFDRSNEPGEPDDPVITLEEGDGPAIDNVMKTDPDCSSDGIDNGSISFSASGGEGLSIMVSGDNPDFVTRDLEIQENGMYNVEDLPSGTYTISVDDDSDCNIDPETITLDDPRPTLTIDGTPDAITDCRPSSTSTIPATVDQTGTFTIYVNEIAQGTEMTLEDGVPFNIELSGEENSVYLIRDNSCRSNTVTKTVDVIAQKPLVVIENRMGPDGCNPNDYGSVDIRITNDNPGPYRVVLNEDTLSGLFDTNPFTISNNPALGPGSPFDVIVVDNNHCSSVTQNNTIPLAAKPAISSIEAFAADSCMPEASGEMRVTLRQDRILRGDYEYSFDGGINFSRDFILENEYTLFISGQVPDDYEVIIRDGGNCVSGPSSTTIGSPELPNIFRYSPNNPPCTDPNGGSIEITAVSLNGIQVDLTNFDFSIFPSDSTNFQPEPLFEGLAAGGYTLYARELTTQCIGNIAINPPLVTPGAPIVEIDFPPTDIAVCDNDNNLITLEATPDMGTWELNGDSYNNQEIDPSSLTPGTYNLKYTYTDGATDCTSFDEKEIIVLPHPELNLRIETIGQNGPVQATSPVMMNSEETIRITGTPAPNGPQMTHKISFRRIENPDEVEASSSSFTEDPLAIEETLVFKGEGQEAMVLYVIEDILTHNFELAGVSMSLDCIENESIEVRVGRELTIPKVLTPNEDGFNDRFRVSGLGEVTGFGLQIYNRKGALIFETQDNKLGWDGGQAPDGVYYYRIAYDGAPDQKGAFLLQRLPR